MGTAQRERGRHGLHANLIGQNRTEGELEFASGTIIMQHAVYSPAAQ